VRTAPQCRLAAATNIIVTHEFSGVIVIRARSTEAMVEKDGRSSGARPREKEIGVFPIVSGLARCWIPLVVVVVVGLSGFAMYRMHGVFGSDRFPGGSSGSVDRIVAFNPKRVVYEVYGPSGTVGSISYLDENASPQRADFTSLPWSFQVATTLPSMFANVVAQGNSDTIGCRISVNGQVREDRSSTGRDAQAFCLVKAA
jgi:hypothetical protein